MSVTCRDCYYSWNPRRPHNCKDRLPATCPRCRSHYIISTRGFRKNIRRRTMKSNHVKHSTEDISEIKKLNQENYKRKTIVKG